MRYAVFFFWFVKRAIRQEIYILSCNYSGGQNDGSPNINVVLLDKTKHDELYSYCNDVMRSNFELSKKH